MCQFKVSWELDQIISVLFSLGFIQVNKVYTHLVETHTHETHNNYVAIYKHIRIYVGCMYVYMHTQWLMHTHTK